MPALSIPFDILSPEWLVAAIALPLTWWFFRRSLVGLNTSQRILLGLLRATVLICLMLAACHMSFLKQSRQTFPVFVIDDTESVGELGVQAAEEYVRTATTGVPADRYSRLRVSSLATTSSSESNFQEAVQAAQSLVPEGAVAHVVLLTDGLETSGSLASVSSRHVVSSIALPRSPLPEIQVDKLSGPARVDSGQTVSLQAQITSTAEGFVALDLFAEELRLESRTIRLTKGKNAVSFRIPVDETTEFRVRVRTVSDSDSDSAAEDTDFDNNAGMLTVSVSGAGRVLIIDRNPEQLTDLKLALQQQKIDVQVVPPAGWPGEMATLQKYDSVILSNVSASETTVEKMRLMKSWVRDFGGGLIMLGGENSFGLGGYQSTPIEEVLPVSCDFQQKEEEPGLAMMMVLDKSDSMKGVKIDSARQAAAASVELLTERDQVGVVAFDGSPFWVSDLVSASQQAQVIDRIAGIQPGGGTNLFPALQEAFGRLRAASSKLKHVLVLTDGYSIPADFEGIVQEMAALRITVSTIGLGAADNELLAKLAEIGRGRHYECQDPSQLPQIFARETMSVSQPAIKEDPVLVDQVRTMPALVEIDFQQAPFLLGYVMTKPRPTSELILVESESRDPVLCWWKYGLGTTVAFTSDAQNRWAAEWLLWDDYGKFWAQLIRFLRPPDSGSDLSVSVNENGRSVQLVIEESVSNQTDDVNVGLSVSVNTPNGRTLNLQPERIAPGRHEVQFLATDPGTYSYRIQEDSVGGPAGRGLSGSLAAGFLNEDRISPANESLLQAVAESSGGRFDLSPEEVFRTLPGKSATTSVALTTYFLVAALLLYVVDVVFRRSLLANS